MSTEDMVLKATRLLNLVLTGMLTGNEFGRLVGFHPALYELPTEAHARGEWAITSRFGKLMPSLPEGCDLVLCAGPLTPQGSSFPILFFMLLGMLCYLAMLAVTFTGNMPANRRTLELGSRTVSRDELLALRRRWDGFHAARNRLNAADLIFAILGTLSDTTPEG